MSEEYPRQRGRSSVRTRRSSGGRVAGSRWCSNHQDEYPDAMEGDRVDLRHADGESARLFGSGCAELETERVSAGRPAMSGPG